jgi:HEXXH motif-containing protein
VTAAAEPVDDLIWTSLEPFEQRARRVAVVWAAIGRVLQEDPPAGVEADEYLELHRWLRGLEPEVFTSLVRTPQAYTWVRRTHAALTACLDPDGNGHREQARRSLAACLEDAKLLGLGAAAATGGSLELSGPHRVCPPISLPMSDLLLVGDGPVTLTGVSAGEMQARDADTTTAAPIGHEPSLPARHGSIRLSPFVLQTSDIESPDRATVLDYGLDGHRTAGAVMERAFDLIAEHAPESHRQIVATMDTIALHDAGRSERSQATLSDVPGTFAMPCSPNPYTDVECVVHEYFHNRLFALEELDRIFEDEREEAGGGPTVFSPWRVEPRPLKGLLHSAYVFAPVAEFWFAVWRAGRAPADQLAFALDETIRHGLQLRMAVELLDRRGRFTAWGGDVLGALDRRVGAYESACREAGVPDDAGAMSPTLDGRIEPLRWDGHDRVSVRENIRANIARGDLNGDVEALGLAV